MSQQKMTWIKGPLHPDLFDGETPIMQHVPVASLGKAFDVTVEYVVRYDEDFSVLALDEDDARTAATVAFFKDRDRADYEIDDIRVAATGGEPDDKMIADFVARTAQKEAA